MLILSSWSWLEKWFLVRRRFSMNGVAVAGNKVVVTDYLGSAFINTKGLSIDEKINSTNIYWTPYYVPQSGREISVWTGSYIVTSIVEKPWKPEEKTLRSLFPRGLESKISWSNNRSYLNTKNPIKVPLDGLLLLIPC